jgi:Endonuclease/Exonuclease/phosphatase family.
MKEILLLLVMFWNVENFFDPFNNPSTNDDAFTPMGEKFWSWKKFNKKRDDIAKVIMLVKEEKGVYPAIIGMCEIENSYVLKELIEKTPLARLGYNFLHKDSPDKRGIDVALLYNKQQYTPIKTDFIPLKVLNNYTPDNLNTKDSILASRLILYSKGLFNNLDTLHIFVNHWPSKLGGEKVSQPKRMLASNTIKKVTDSILKVNSAANIILMGDFNDTPNSLPMKNLQKFRNLSENVKNLGTHKYKESWELIDQFLITDNLLKDSTLKYIYTKDNGMEVFAPKQMLQRDELYLGVKLKKSLSGPRYLGGVSDHLPILLKIYGLEY